MRKKAGRLGISLAAAVLLCTAVPTQGFADSGLERRKESSIRTDGLQVQSLINLSDVKNREIIIKTNGSIDRLLKKYTLSKTSGSTDDAHYIVKVPASAGYDSVLAKLKRDPAVVLAEPNYLGKTSGFGYTNPNDQFYPRQWHLPKIGMPSVWKGATPKKQPLVAVLDSGVDYNHPDLAGRIVKGYDYVGKDSDPMDRLGHGTAVAGSIAALSNNNIGVAGVNSKARILAVRVANDKGMATMSDVAKGIDYAVKKKADIINLSLGAPQPSELVFDALYKAYQKGIVIIASSGNNSSSSVSYPAAFPFVISVGATNQKDGRSSFSNYGTQLDLAAPGEDIITTGLNKGYVQAEGTSFSAPLVSGTASALLSVYPDLNPLEVQYLIEKGTKKLSKSKNGWSKSTGFGRVSASGAFNAEFPSLKADAGNTRSKAKTVKYNTAYKDKYDYAGDSDWFKLTVKKKAKVKVTLSGVDNINAVIWADQYKNGKVVKEKQYNTGGIGKKESFTYWVVPGTHYFEIYDKNNHWSQAQKYSFKVTKLDTTPPAVPKANKVTSKSVKVTGTAEKNSKLELKKGKTVLAKGKANSKGKYSIKIKKQKKGTVLYLTAKDKAGNKSKALKITVK